MQLHEDSFDLPAGAVRLMSNGVCANQGLRVGRTTYGFQFHFEVTKARCGQFPPRLLVFHGASLRRDGRARRRRCGALGRGAFRGRCGFLPPDHRPLARPRDRAPGLGRASASRKASRLIFWGFPLPSSPGQARPYATSSAWLRHEAQHLIDQSGNQPGHGGAVGDRPSFLLQIELAPLGQGLDAFDEGGAAAPAVDEADDLAGRRIDADGLMALIGEPARNGAPGSGPGGLPSGVPTGSRPRSRARHGDGSHCSSPDRGPAPPGRRAAPARRRWRSAAWSRPPPPRGAAPGFAGRACRRRRRSRGRWCAGGNFRVGSRKASGRAAAARSSIRVWGLSPVLQWKSQSRSADRP